MELVLLLHCKQFSSGNYWMNGGYSANWTNYNEFLIIKSWE